MRHRVGLFRRRAAGITLLEIMVVLAIVTLLASLVIPIISEARKRARLIQCTSQFRQIGQALMMYDLEHNPQVENYPDRLTHLCALKYLPDPRVFVCPSDTTHARGSTLKPGHPKDNKGSWAERRGMSDHGMPMEDCSYLYEFSTRFCQGYTPHTPGGQLASWSGDGFANQALVGWYGNGYFYDANGILDYSDENNQIDGCPDPADPNKWLTPPLASYFDYDPANVTDRDTVCIVSPANPMDVDWERKGYVTWQDAKFFQLNHADSFTSGVAFGAGTVYPSSEWFITDYIIPPCSDVESLPMSSYPRTWFPIVRCFWHMPAGASYDDHQVPSDPMYKDKVDDEGTEQVLNLAVDGNTFFSVPGWEMTAWKCGRTADPAMLP